MLDREYRVARLRYSRVLFTSEYQLCANLRVLAYLTTVNGRVSPLLCGHHARVRLVVKTTETYDVTPRTEHTVEILRILQYILHNIDDH